MTIFQAKEYDPRVDKRRRIYVISALIIIAVLIYLGYHFRNWREEQTVNHFFAAIEQKNYEKAYAIWNADPNWKQHPQKYSGYNFGTFELDWGPTGEYGDIRSHHIRAAINPKNASGVVVVVKINDRREPMALWVQKKDQSITFLPPTLNVQIKPD
ncbi:MAG TPA: hypothetical protein VFQ00_09675 [Terriglobales bacterium]|nr:hypothetical protein [Terriglobales bacterium]